MKKMIVNKLYLFDEAFNVENYSRNPLRFAIE